MKNILCPFVLCFITLFAVLTLHQQAIATSEVFVPVLFEAEYRTGRFLSDSTPFPRGDIVLGDVDFSIPTTGNFVATTYMRSETSAPTTFTIQVSVDSVKNVYVLLNSGWSWSSLYNKAIGSIELSFSDGSSETTQLLLGRNIRNDARDPAMVTTTSDPNVTEVWLGIHANGTLEAFVDMLKIPVDNSSKLMSMTFTDYSDPDPGLLIAGITIEQVGDNGSIGDCGTNATFDPSTGILNVPAIDVPGIFGGTQTYWVKFKLKPGSDPPIFELTDAGLVQ